MSRLVASIDTNGFFIGEIILEIGAVIPANCIDVRPKEGFYLPKWDGTSWIEGMTQVDINVIKNMVLPKTEVESLREQLTETKGAIDFILMNF